MKTSNLNEIKNELINHDREHLMSYCLRLIKYKKENKELMTFLLFRANDLTSYLEEIKYETSEMFNTINNIHIHFVKKSVRKILRFINKQSKFITEKSLEAEMRIHFCNCMLSYSIPLKKSRQILNLYDQQLKKIDEILSALHPDLQFDLKKMLLLQ